MRTLSLAHVIDYSRFIPNAYIRAFLGRQGLRNDARIPHSHLPAPIAANDGTLM